MGDLHTSSVDCAVAMPLNATAAFMPCHFAGIRVCVYALHWRFLCYFLCHRKKKILTPLKCMHWNYLLIVDEFNAIQSNPIQFNPIATCLQQGRATV